MKTWNDYKNYARAQSPELRRDIDEAEALSGIFEMSIWSYVCGVMEVEVFGNTQAQCTYMLQTVIDHMPKIYGSEGPCDIYIVQRKDNTVSSDFDEFGHKIEYGIEYHEIYNVVLSGYLRDVSVRETYKNVVRFLCRFSKRMLVQDVCVTIRDFSQYLVISDKNKRFTDMFEDWMLFHGGEPNWCEYLMPVCNRELELPAILAHKYRKNQRSTDFVEQMIQFVNYTELGDEEDNKE